MKYRFECLGATLLMALVCQTVHPEDVPATPLMLVTSKLGTFEIVSHRMGPVGIGAVAGGLLGAAIESSVHSSQDEAMKKHLLQTYPEASCDKPLLEAFSDRIRASGAFALDSQGKTGTSVDIEIGECGFHLADTSVGEYASYVYLKLKVKPATGAAWNESIQVSGRNRYDFEDLINQPGLAKSEMEDALKRAGMRSADKIIYKK